MSDPCKRCGGRDDHNHDLTDCVARLITTRREQSVRIAELETELESPNRKVRAAEKTIHELRCRVSELEGWLRGLAGGVEARGGNASSIRQLLERS